MPPTIQPATPTRRALRVLRAILGLTLCVALAVGAQIRTSNPARASANSAIAGLHVQGNKLVNGAGQAIVLHGVDRSGTEYACIQGWGLFDGPNDAASVQAIANWHANAVRVPLNEDCWLGINGAPAAYSGAAYQQAIANYVGLLNQNGLVAILDLHWTAAGSAQATGQQQMADADHAVAFWGSVASAFKGNGSVIFDLFNEPYNISWSCWRDGGTCAGVPYAVAGMQSLVAAVRNTGATNVLMAGGLAWSNDLSQWLAYRPNDPLGNLVAAWHVYNFNACSNGACYDSTVAPVMQQVPLVAGEIGENDCTHNFVDTTMAWLDAHGGGYIGWSWNTADCANGPALITDYAGSPTAFGQGLRARLAMLASGAPAATATTAATASALPTTTPVATATPTSPTTPLASPTTPPASPTTPPASPTVRPSPATATPPAIPAQPAPPASPSPAASPSAGGPIAAGSVAGGSGPWWSEEDVKITNSAPVTALRLVVTVQKTAGVGYTGQYTTFWTGMALTGHTDNGNQIVYTYALADSQTLPAGSWVVGAQFAGSGMPHAYNRDTFTMTATSGGVTTTSAGHF